MANPRIGITANYRQQDGHRYQCYLKADYVDAVSAGGALPLLLPPIDSPETYLQHIDGLIFTGGYDMKPGHYGQPLHPETVLIERRRDEAELRLMTAAMQSKVPLLAICLGCQWLNVVRGGTLHQHLPEIAGFDDHGFDERVTQHVVHISPGSRLHSIVEMDQFSVASSHHQAIATVGEGLDAVGTAADGIVEAVEDPARRFCIGVQWHPESKCDQAQHRALFAGLIRACKEEMSLD